MSHEQEYFNHEIIKPENRQDIIKNNDDEELESITNSLDNMSEDQKRAATESENLRIDLGYTEREDPYESPDDSYQKYVRERLREVNKEFEDNNNNNGDEMERIRKISFSSNVIEVAPSPIADSEIDDNQDIPKPISNDINENLNTGGDKNRINETSYSLPKNQNDENVLVQRHGKFQLVKKNELEANDLEVDVSDENNNNKNNNPKPPSEPRPSTANTARPIQSEKPHRSKSADSKNSSKDWNISNYKSPYALTDEQKKEAERQKKYKENEEHREKDKNKAEKQREAEENNDTFQFWLNNKNKEEQKRRREEEQIKKQEREYEEQKKKEKNDPDIYKGWLEVKKRQQQQNKLIEKERQKEIDENKKPFSCSRRENEKVFRKWLKKKIEEEKRKRQEINVKNKTNKLLSKRTRNKALLLTYAVKQQSSFRYVDYYGYRF